MNTPIIKESYILVNYIFLNDMEKYYFSTNDIEYIIPLINNVLEQDASSINKNYKLTLNHPHKMLYWRAQLNSERDNNNHFNYLSNPITSNNEPLILTSKLVINSIPRLEITNFEFYNYLQSYINNFTLIFCTNSVIYVLCMMFFSVF